MAPLRARSVTGFVLLLCLGLAGTLVFVTDLRQVGTVLSNLGIGYLALAVAATVVSYLFNYLAFRGLSRAVDCTIPSVDLFRIAFASTTVSYLFSVGGVSGMTLRLYLLGRQGIRAHATLLISLVTTLLNNVVLLLFVLLGFGRLLLNGSLGPVQQLLAGIIVALSAALVVSAFVGLYNRRVLDLVLALGIRIVRRVAAAFPSVPVLRSATEPKLQEFRKEFHAAVALVTSRRRKIAIPFIHLIIDWGAAAAVLYFCFLATGYFISPGTLAAGFSIGVFVFLISVVPGGLGIMEASMAALYVSLGVPLEESVVALLAYRVLYYFLPFGLSLLLCGGLLKEARARAGRSVPAEPPR